jgi:catechol 2,3-dioxygenase-like lactoylglutathione lyase family enzyme
VIIHHDVSSEQLVQISLDHKMTKRRGKRKATTAGKKAKKPKVAKGAVLEPMRIGSVALLVKDQDEALKWWTEKADFVKDKDEKMGDTRIVTIKPTPASSISIMLVLADTEAKKSLIGKQAGDGVLMTVEVNDLKKIYEEQKKKGVEFIGEPKEESFGTFVLYKDICGNTIRLLQPTTKEPETAEAKAEAKKEEEEKKEEE